MAVSCCYSAPKRPYPCKFGLVWLGTILLQLSCPCRQVQLCNPILSCPFSAAALACKYSCLDVTSTCSMTGVYIVATPILRQAEAFNLPTSSMKCPYNEHEN
eukprot:1160932-Pelagomonas_calceolata.AAC.11